jgi:squalene-hopene/tetraprenyl-beta-curcumene cyclase
MKIREISVTISRTFNLGNFESLRIEAGGLYDPTPIGFYFAKLWYFEKLYPLIFTVGALGRATRTLRQNAPPA